ncbi:MAG: SpoIIE family protein phosphatase, partial [Acidobacteriota bacterium]|nr:SpoIIE family protein phosphatase [Acidobacteriota bacterium]
MRRIVRALWRRASVVDRVAVLLVVLFAIAQVAQLLGWQPGEGAISTATGFLSFFFFVSIVYLLVRSRRWIAGRLLWKLRNRLILAYIFIAVVPVVLLLAMGGIVTYMADVEVAAHLLHDDFRDRMQQVSATSREALALARVIAVPSSTPESLDKATPIQVLVKSVQDQLPGLIIELSPATQATQVADSTGDSPHMVERGDKLWIEANTVGQLPDSRWIEARARLPVTSTLLDALSPELGPITLGAALTGPSVSTRHRVLPPPRNWFDLRVVGATTFDAVRTGPSGKQPAASPRIDQIPATFSLRSSSMSKRIAGSLGEFEGVVVALLLIVGGLFIVLWLLAFIAGMVITRTITRTVNKLDEATQHVKAADFSHRISIERRDQLGALAESFNSMTTSIEGLLDEQRQRQRLENELTIAREVQTQLFPRSLPAMAGFELGAVCRAARIVSGDYYDCLQLDAHRVAIAVADISGKGISAALLMASLNAALRSLVISDGVPGIDPAALAQRLNRHLLLNTSDDRYATFFFAVYDSSTHRLDYTNAGHLPPFFINGDRVEKLDCGGPVIGLLDGCVYERASIEVQPGSLLVAYSDGMTEPENAYGEEFGPDRLVAEILRHRSHAPERLCDELIDAVKNWCAPEEPF